MTNRRLHASHLLASSDRKVGRTKDRARQQVMWTGRFHRGPYVHTCECNWKLHADTDSLERQLLLKLRESMCLCADAGDD